MSSSPAARRVMIAALFAEYAGLCAYCLQPAMGVDHIVPRSKGGGNGRDNLVPCCRSCNESKGDKKLIIWLATCGPFCPTHSRAAIRAHPALRENRPLKFKMRPPSGGWLLD